MAISDPWYKRIVDRYGEEYARIAGYFDEDKPFISTYTEHFPLPYYHPNLIVLQYSGAFYPFHEGHLAAIMNAAKYIRLLTSDEILVIIHADHNSYRESKGVCDALTLYQGSQLQKQLKEIPNLEYMVVDENKMPDGCSRNFTRLYAELSNRGHTPYFVCGGDRANFALSFRDHGKCIVSGRDQTPTYNRYHFLSSNPNIIFLPGNVNISSTEIRNENRNPRSVLYP